MHVDACVGSYVLPFAKKSGIDLPDFDLSVPGVCSLSADRANDSAETYFIVILGIRLNKLIYNHKWWDG
jgi:hypothetical protein